MQPWFLHVETRRLNQEQVLDTIENTYLVRLILMCTRRDRTVANIHFPLGDR